MGGLSKPFLIHLISWTQEPGQQTKSSFTHAATAYSYMWSQESVHHKTFFCIPPPFCPSRCLRFPLLPQLIRPQKCFWLDISVDNHVFLSPYLEDGKFGESGFGFSAESLPILLQEYAGITWKMDTDSSQRAGREDLLQDYIFKWIKLFSIVLSSSLVTRKTHNSRGMVKTSAAESEIS